MLNKILSAITLAAVLAVAVGPLAVQAADDAATWDGLQKVKSKKMDEAYLLPGADFREYSKVMLDPAEVAFAKNWQREVNRSKSAGARVTDEHAAEIRKAMSDGLGEIFAKDLGKAGYAIVAAPGPDVLRITPVLVNVYINAPDTGMSSPGRSYTYTVEAGEATLGLELRDSGTQQLLGRAVDRRRTGETGRMTWTTSVTNRAEFERVFKTWSSILVDGLGALKDASPIQPK
ncbi:MAG: hypothetical protein H6R27_1800 [Proteobacteria bacterium]|nr:hypothetical protein [Pseudomonadota bacterium]